MGSAAGAKLGWARRRKGYPKKCEGPGKYQHVRRCQPSRPMCRWMRKKKYKTCTCGTPAYPHRLASVDWKNRVCCMQHPEHDRIMFEMVYHRDYDTGEELGVNAVKPERYEKFKRRCACK